MTPKNNATELFKGMTAGEPVRQGKSEAQMLFEMEDRSLARGPMQTPTLELPFLLEKTATIRRPNETVLAFIARTGLNPRQITEWTLPRIASFVVQQERQEKDQIIL